jgi:hypothetical protein
MHNDLNAVGFGLFFLPWNLNFAPHLSSRSHPARLRKA